MADRLLVSTRKGLFHLERRGAAWGIARVSFLGHNATLARPDARDGSIYATLNLGHFGVKLHRSTDDGQSWEELSAPAYPAGEMVHTADGKPPTPATLKMIWSLETGTASQPGRLWAGTLPGGLFRSDDRGKNWELVRTLWDRPEREKWMGGGADTPGIHSICIDPRDSNVMCVSVSCAGNWRTCDGGLSWAQSAHGMYAEYMPPEMRMLPDAQDPHRMVQCPEMPDLCWVQHHNGVFKSVDAGVTWTDVTAVRPSKFGFAVAVHPKDGRTAWFVPGVKDECRVAVDAKLVVTRTRDGGESFDVLTRGLPTQPAYDIVFRHALDIDETGESLAFGSTTGGLWTTHDHGDTWTQLPARLPPVHAVAFVK